MNKVEYFKLLSKLASKESKKSRLNIVIMWTSILFWTGNYSNALKNVKTLKNEESAWINCWCGVLSYLQHDYLNAQTFFENALMLNKSSPEIKFFLAETYFSRSDIEKAVKYYRTTIKNKDLQSKSLYKIACCLAKKGRNDEAIGFLNRALKNANSSEKVDILNKKGLCFMAQGCLDKAETNFKKCLEYSPNNIVAHKNLALTLSKMKDYQNASKLYKKILSKQPYDITSINNMAHCAAALKRYNDAIKYCNIGLAIDPINSDLLINKGCCMYKIGDYKNALECLKEAEKRVKDDIVLLNNKALCYIAINEYDKALNIFDFILQKKRLDDIMINKGFCLFKKGLYKEALDILDNVKQIGNNNEIDIYTIKGICYEMLGDNEKAVEYYNKSLIV
jgi:tetratricopeptide (TPR) repeat protein